MSLESGTYINDLVVTNPPGTDDRSTADDHLRLIKNVLKNSIPLTGAVTSTHAELNLLDGCTATTAELNHLAGSTTGTVLTTGDEGSGNGIDADTVDTYEGAALLARANHTGTQTLATISDSGNLAAISLVTQAYLSTSIGSVTSTGLGSFTLPGGQYGFYPQHRSSDGNSCSSQIVTNNTSTTFATLVGSVDLNTASNRWQQRYILASPPFNLGHGDIRVFVFAVVDNTTSKVLGYYLADVPPWAYNGPTSIAPTRVDLDTGKKYIRRKKPGLLTPADALLSARMRDKFLEERANPQYEEVEITQEMKNADMPLIPHFAVDDVVGTTKIVLDPQCPHVQLIAELYEEQTQEAFDMIEDIIMSHTKVDNTALPIGFHDTVQAVSCDMR